MEIKSAKCEGCGLEMQGGADACHLIYENLLARDFSNPTFFRFHRLLVDIYCLQHPDRYCVSAKSLVAHLAGLAYLLESKSREGVGSNALKKWLDGAISIEKPHIPAFRGKLTIADVQHINDPVEYERALNLWAQSTWQAYSSLHAMAKGWLQMANASASL